MKSDLNSFESLSCFANRNGPNIQFQYPDVESLELHTLKRFAATTEVKVRLTKYRLRVLTMFAYDD